MVACGERGDSVDPGRGSAGPSHTFTRGGVGGGASGGGPGVPGHRLRRQPSRCAPPAGLPACPPASLSAAATAGPPAPAQRPPRAGRGTASGSTRSRLLLAGNNRLRLARLRVHLQCAAHFTRTQSGRKGGRRGETATTGCSGVRGGGNVRVPGGAVAERPPGARRASRRTEGPRDWPGAALASPGKVLSQPLQMFRAGGLGPSALCDSAGARGAHFPRCGHQVTLTNCRARPG